MDRHQMRNAEFWTAVHAIVIVLFAFFMFIVGFGLGYRECEEINCANCDKKMSVTRIVDINYTTKKLKNEKE